MRGLNLGLWSIRSLPDSEIHRESETGSSKLTKFSAARPALSNVGAKGTESGGKGRQIDEQDE